jgi:hypothetical protein
MQGLTLQCSRRQLAVTTGHPLTIDVTTNGCLFSWSSKVFQWLVLCVGVWTGCYIETSRAWILNYGMLDTSQDSQVR